VADFEEQTIADTEPHKLLISAAVATLEALTAVMLNILVLLDACYVDWCKVTELCLQLPGTLVPKKVGRNSSAFFFRCGPSKDSDIITFAVSKIHSSSPAWP